MGSAVRLPRFLRRKPKSELERENAALKKQLTLAGIFVYYFASTRRPCECDCHKPKHRARHRWRTNLHAPTEIFTKTYR